MSPAPANPAPVTLVTGASRGIGRHLAEHYLGLGHRVVGCSRSPASIPHPDFDAQACDVTDESQVTALLRHVARRYGRLDIAINNAGIAAMNAALLTPAASAIALLHTNFLGAFLVCREAAKLMVRHRSGRIVNFTTVAVPLRLEGEALYAASKAAVETFTRIFAREVGEFGITVNAVGPAPVPTDLIRNVPAPAMEAVLHRLALHRPCTCAEVAHVVDFLVAPASQAVTGQVIYLGGA